MTPTSIILISGSSFIAGILTARYAIPALASWHNKFMDMLNRPSPFAGPPSYKLLWQVMAENPWPAETDHDYGCYETDDALCFQRNSLIAKAVRLKKNKKKHSHILAEIQKLTTEILRREQAQ